MVTDVRVSKDAAVNAYDANTNEMIEKSEVIDAIRHYFNYEIEKGIVLDLIRLYFGPTLTPPVALVMDSEATVTGYWSDGSANVEVTVSLAMRAGPRLGHRFPIYSAGPCGTETPAWRTRSTRPSAPPLWASPCSRTTNSSITLCHRRPVVFSPSLS